MGKSDNENVLVIRHWSVDILKLHSLSAFARVPLLACPAVRSYDSGNDSPRQRIFLVALAIRSLRPYDQIKSSSAELTVGANDSHLSSFECTPVIRYRLEASGHRLRPPGASRPQTLFPVWERHAHSIVY